MVNIASSESSPAQLGLVGLGGNNLFYFCTNEIPRKGIRRKLLRKIVEVAWGAGMETLVATSGADYHTLFCSLGFRQVALEMRLDRFENR
jgi:hypothetical protein